MSTDTGGIASIPVPRVFRSSWLDDLRTVRVLRYALGSTLSVAIAFALEWPLSFLSPVFTALLLSLPLPRPTPKRLLIGVGQIFIAFILGLLFAVFLQPFPMVYTLALGLVMFHVYYRVNRGGSVWLALMCLIAILILPMLVAVHDELPVAFALYFACSAALAMAIHFLAHVVLPDPTGNQAPVPRRPFVTGYSPDAAFAALKSAVVMLPLAVLFIANQWSSQVLVLVFAGVFSLSPEVAAGKASGVKSMTSTLLGGVAAVVVYGLIIAVPEFHFFVILMFLVLLLFGSGIYSDNPNAKYLGSAATGVIILLASVMDQGASITDALLIRVLLIAAATLYVVSALAVLDRFAFKSRGTPAGHR